MYMCVRACGVRLLIRNQNGTRAHACVCFSMCHNRNIKTEIKRKNLGATCFYR